ncbi:hypothetical protein TUM20985_01940 [Mycobacterium antarcticum]|uniref:hypothetical protein n=1 Tax=unclassified Mycolicibacterium TaxID=2636767 RepID=UPI00238A7113|nr:MULTISPECIES: hypothetical protein [unclassified Mycolicibacterium]BDX29647.1 hypothetical protein TUM20985_01940 [Mycolicibacterium sp. TUM20985]GLP78793.1 hypothetical protein TUM20984_02130 [Mycolicibacterium sp. TUM20984]
MAESEASGEARVDDPVDDTVDTDQLAVDQPGDVEAPAADGDFGYLFDEPDEVAAAEVRDGPEWVESAPPMQSQERTVDAFNAFDASTWNFKPMPTPWYRTGKSLAVLVVVSLAAITLVVSGVLLAFRGPSNDEPVPTRDTSTAPTPSTAPSTTRNVPLPPPPPPPPPPPSASEIQRAPVAERRPPRPTKKPEINVTRSPLSVSPQKPSR